ncbi:MFS transporter [Mycolicibacterium sp.]|uniref:MFS transporter n=1 Tax=Mycolicibacterium sp. TaxID=2320850 RepID=UPI003D103800
MLSVGFVLAATTLPVFVMGSMARSLGADPRFERLDVTAAVTVFFACSALSAPVSGVVADRVGAAWSLTLAAVASAGAAATLAGLGDPRPAVALMGLAGAANVLAQTSGNLVLADQGSPRYAGAAFGIKQSAVPVATMLAGLAVPLFDSAGQWRMAFAACAVLVIGSTVVALLVIRKSRPRRARSPAGVIDRRLVAALAVAAFLATGTATSVVIYFVSFAAAYGVDAGTAGLVLACAGAIGVALRVGSGVALDRVSRAARSRAPLRCASAMVIVGAMGTALLAASAHTPVLMSCGVVLAVGVGWSWPGLMHLVIVDRNRGAAGRATGIVLAGVFGGSVTMPALSEVLVDATSYPVTWLAGSGCMAVAAAMFALAGTPRRSPRE